MVVLPFHLVPRTLDLLGPDLAGEIAQIPKGGGIYVLQPSQGMAYVGRTAFLGKRLARLLLHPKSSSNSVSNPWEAWNSVYYWLSGSRLQTSLLTYEVTRCLNPADYHRRLKLRAPYFVSLLLSDAFPRIALQARIPKQRSRVYGPFQNRDSASRFEQEVLGLFQIRRCDETLLPSPEHPGCIYGEMNLCMRPCQAAVSSEEYAAEVARVEDFLDSNGHHQIVLLGSARDRASHDMDFEQAARLHKQWERLKAVTALRDELVEDIDRLNGVALTRGAEAGQILLWPMLAGYWQRPLPLDFSMKEAQVRSLDSLLRSELQVHLQTSEQTGVRSEHISLLARWYYSSWRDGEWFPFREIGGLNYRKLVRGISALLRDPAPESTAI